jgi:hypothetical protein
MNRSYSNARNIDNKSENFNKKSSILASDGQNSMSY